MFRRVERSPPRPRLRVEALEPRILYSADAAAALGLAGYAGGAGGAEVRQIESPAVLPTIRHEIVFVDAAVPDGQALVDALLARRGLQTTTQATIEIVQLRADADGLAQISAVLAGERAVDAVHIVSHGDAGRLQLGNGIVDAATLRARADSLSTWRQALTQDADLLLWGCDVGAGAQGAAFVGRLAELTGADVAASSDATGAAARGGNWTLEVETGRIDSLATFSAAGNAAWNGLLALTPQGSETRVNTNATGLQAITTDGGGNIAIDSAGNFVVVWEDMRTNAGDIYFQRYNAAGVAQGGNTQVNTYTSNLQDTAQVAMDGSGNFVVTWVSTGQDGSGEGIYAQRYDASGVAQGSEFRVNTTTANVQDHATVAMSASGAFVIAWDDAAADGSGQGVYAQRYDAAGVAQGAQFRVNTFTSSNQAYASAAMDGSGNFVITWESFAQDGSGNGAYAQRYNTAGIAQGGEFRVATATAGDQWNTAVSMDSSGSFVVVWESGTQDTGGNAGIYGQRYNAAGVAQGGEFRVNTTSADDQTLPAVAMNASGGFVVSWMSNLQDGSGLGVYAQQYDAAGNALGSETRVNTTTASDQAEPSIAYAGNKVVIVWDGNGSGDADGVFVQRYTASAPGITVTPTAGLLTTEAGGTAQFNVVLDSAPTGNVTIAVSSNDTGEGTVSTSVLIFTTANWGTPQSVTVTGVNDALADGLQAYSIVLAAASSSDASYNGLNPSDVQAATSDNDINYGLITVDTTADTADGDTSSLTALATSRGADGVISLREAITAANNTANGAGGADRVDFNIAGTGPHVISLTSALPSITEALVIDGSSEPDYVANTPAVRIDGASAGAGVDALTFTSTSDNSTVRGLMITRFSHDGIMVQSGADNITIAGNWIGTTGTGSTGVGNTNTGIESFGIGTVIGGSGATDRNVITNSGNDGVSLGAAGVTGYVIQGNYIGLDPDGATGGGNIDVGVAILSGTGNTIGGTTLAARNLISKNWEGIEINTANNTIQGNYIGTDGTGTLNRGNRIGDGIQIQGSANNTIVGGSAAGAGNLIAYNALSGVAILAGIGHQVLGNTILGNTNLGIDLGTAGVTANDAAPDADTGANNLQNFPALTSANSNSTGTTIVGTLNSNANTSYRIELFGNRPSVADASNGEGERFLGFISVVTDGAGNATINTLLTNTWVNQGDKITATATVDLGGGNFGSTSEFAANVTATANGIIVVDTTSDVADGTTTSITNLGNNRGADGRISLREAIAAANNTANGGTPDKIVFDIPVTDANHVYYANNGVIGNLGAAVATPLADAQIADFDPDYAPGTARSWYRIALTGNYLDITQAVTIDGSTQAGYSFAGAPVIEIDAAGVTTPVGDLNAIALTTGASTLRGLVIHSAGDQGIEVDVGASGSVIVGNYLGTDVSGTKALGNGWSGIGIKANNVLVGGSTAADRNLISGNTGTGFAGVEIYASASGTIVRGNTIGTTVTGNGAIPNTGAGVNIYGSATSAMIGGTGAGEGNLIASNGAQGVWVQSGSGSAVLGNSIYSNGTLGIDLGATTGVTANDAGDADTGANNLQNFPLLVTARTDGAGQLIVTGALNSSANSFFRIEFFANTAQDGSGYGEGRSFIGFVNVATDVAGNATIGATISASVAVGSFISATATKSNAGYSAFTDTSEFARNIAAVSSTQATITVDTVSDTSDGDTTSLSTLLANKGADGFVSLREAITAANNSANGSSADRIDFNIAGAGPHTINVGTALPTITSAVVIDASSEPDFAANGNRPIVVLDGNDLAADGLVLGASADGSTIRGLVIRDFGGDGIEIQAGSDGNTIAGNFIGRLDTSGADAGAGEANGGIGINVLSAGNTLGGSTAADRNVVSGNLSYGIDLAGSGASGNTVAGNYIGLNAAGTAAIGNGNDGVILLDGASGNTIGGATAGHRNVIAGNSDGVQLGGTLGGSNSNIIRGNYIGTDATGTIDLGNTDDGVDIDNAALNNQVIGNLIAGNSSDGIDLGDAGASTGTIIQGNLIGTAANGSGALGNSGHGILIGNGGTANNTTVGGTGAGQGNTIAFNAGDGIFMPASTAVAILGNTIHANGGQGIDLGANGVTANDAGDADTGANNLQNFPVLSAARTDGSSQLIASGTLSSSANSYYRIEFFANASPDGSGYGEGQTFLGFVNMATDGSGNATISATLSGSVAAGSFISATATRSNAGFTLFTDTSEFAQNVVATVAPVATNLNAAETYTEGMALNLTDIVISDADSANVTATLTLSNAAAGSLSTASSGAVTSSYIAGAGVWTASGAVADVNALLAGVSFTPTATFNANFTIATSVSDGVGASLTGTKAMTGTPVNNPPAVSTTGGALAYTENGAATAVDSGLAVSDADGGNLGGATVSIAAGFAPAEDTLAYTNQNGISGSWNAGTGVLTLTGSATVADYQTALRSISYVNSSDNPSTATRTVSFVVSDGTANSNTGTRTLSVAAVNDAPAISSNGGGASAAVSVAEGGGVVTSVSSTDPDGGAPLYSILAGGDGAQFSINASTGALSFITAPDFENPTDAGGNNVYNVTVQVSDGLLSDTQAIAVTVTNVNDAPTLGNGTLGAVAEDTASPAGQSVSTVFTGQFADVDAGASFSGIAVVGNTANALTQGSWQYSSNGGGTWFAIGTVADGASALALSGSTLVRFVPVADYNGSPPALLVRALDDSYSGGFSSTTGSESRVTLDSSANGGATAIAAATASLATSVTAVNDAAVVTATGTPLAYTENAAATAVDAGLTVADVDSANLSSATVTVSANYANGQDVLAFADQLGITGSWNALSGTLTLSGSATVADYQTALRSVGYVNTSDTPSTTPRTVSFVVNDGAANSNTGTRTLSVAAVNDAPVLSGANNLTTLGEDPSSNPGTLVSALIAGLSSDADAGAASGIAVTAVDNGNGTWQYSTNGGGAWLSFGLPSTASARLLAADASTLVRFVPNANWSGTVANGITFQAWDQTSGSAGGTGVLALAETLLDSFSATSYGNNNGTASWSTAWVENDSAAGGAAGGEIKVAAGRLSVRSTVPGDSIYRQADLTGATAASLSFDYTNSLGSGDRVDLQVSSNGGGGYVTLATFSPSSNTGTGATSIDISAYIASNTRVRFVVVTQSNDQFLYVDNVQIAYSAAFTGGSTAFSTASASASVVVTAVNDAPALSATGSTLAYTENAAATAVDAGLTVADVDSANLSSATVTVSANYANGQDMLAFADQLGITGSWNALSGTLTLSGSATVADYQTALRSVSYVNTSDTPSTTPRTVSFVVSDGAANSNTGTRSISVATVDDAPVIGSNGGGATAAISVAENLTAVSTVTSTDVDGGTAVYSISGGADAARFTIDSSTGALSFIAAPDFEAPTDAGGNNVYDVTVQVSDGAGGSDTQAIAVTVANVNEAPVITSNGGGSSATLSVAENQGAVTTVASADADGGAPIYAIVGGADAARFTIDPSTGVLAFVSAPDFEMPADAGGNNVYGVTVQVSDGSLTDTQAIAVTVGNVNEAPVITSDGGTATAAINVAENALAVTAVTAGDVDAATTLTYSISGGADAAKFAIDASTGALTFAAAPNYEAPTDLGANNVYDVIVQVSDGTLTDTQAIAVTVTPVNDNPPTITSDGAAAAAAVNAAENGTAVTTVTATDADLPGQALTFSISGGVDAAKFSIDSSTGVLRFVAAPNFEVPTDAGTDNIYDVTVQVDDGNGGIDTQAIAVTVGNVNEAPLITSNGGAASAAVNAAENQTAVTTLTASDVDGGAPVYTIVGGGDQALFSINASTGVLTFNTAPNFEAPADAGGNNVYDVTVQVDDGNGGIDTQAIAVSVGDVNEAPSLSDAAATVAEGATISFDLAAAASDPDAGLPGTIDPASVVVSSGPRHGSLVVRGDGTATYVHDGSETVQDDFVYQLRDATGAVSNLATVRITVTPVDDAPTVTLAPLALAARQAVLLSPALLQAADPDSATATLSFVVTEASHGQFERVVAPGAAIVQFTPADVAAGQVRFVSTSTVDAPSFALAAFDGVSRGAEVPAQIRFSRLDGGATEGTAAEPQSGGSGAATLPELAPPAIEISAFAPAAAVRAGAASAAVVELAPRAGVASGVGSSEAVLAGLEIDTAPARPTPSALAATVAPSRVRGGDNALELAERVAVDDADLAVQLLALATPLDVRPTAHAGNAGDELAAVQASSEAEPSVLSPANAARAGGLALTAGTVWWALRAGGLAASLLASLPAWRNADLLAVLPDDDDDEEDRWEPAEDAEAERDEQAAEDVFALAPQGDAT